MTKKALQVWTRPSVLLALASLLLHAFANGHYGFFRDELYFIASGDRPDWGYVDQPAVVPLLASWSHHIFGDFLWGFRLLRANSGRRLSGAGADLSSSRHAFHHRHLPAPDLAWSQLDLGAVGTDGR